MKNKLNKKQRAAIVQVFRDEIINSLLELDDPILSAKRLRETLPWPLGPEESAKAMNDGIREAVEIVIRGGANHEI